MSVLVVPEHGLLLRGRRGQPSGHDEQGRPVLSHPHFEALRRLDASGAATRGMEALEWGADSARATQFVGVMQVPGLSLEVLPKIGPALDRDAGRFSRRNLLHMLQLAGDVPTRERGVAAQDAREAPLSETLIALFARRLQSELLLGRERRYLERRDNLPALRGKLLFGPHIRHNVARKTRFFVEHAALSADTPLNRALKTTCRHLMALTTMPESAEALRHCLLCLHGVSDAPLPPEALSRITLTRQSARFGPLLDFCKVALSQRSPTATAGETRSFALLFDMSVVFERYIATLIRTEVMSAFPWHTVHVHARRHWRYLLRTQDRRRGVLRLEPDLLFTRQGSPDQMTPLATLDTKWKRLDQRGQRRGVAREDLYQLFAYAQRYACPHNVLLYPHVPGARTDAYLIPNPEPSRHHEDERQIWVRFVNLNRDLSRERRALVEELRALLTPLLERPLTERAPLI